MGISVGLLAALTAGASAPAAAHVTLAVVSGPALAGGEAHLHALAATERITGAVVLKPRTPAGLTRFIKAVTDPRSADYGRYLGAGAFDARFGPSPAVVDAVRAQLGDDHLRVAPVSGDGLLVPFSGSVDRVQAAFHTALAAHRLADGRLARGTVSAVRLPAAIARSVAAVVGLDELSGAGPAGVPHPTAAGIRGHPAARSSPFDHPAGSPRGCSDARSAAVAADGLTDDQIANAYGAFGLYAAGDRGAGQSIAIYENEPFEKSDIRTFDSCYFGNARAGQMMRRLHVIAVAGGQPSGPGTGEASLDVEDVSAMAPGATIDVYEGPYTGANPTDYDSLDEYAAIVDADRDRIVSTSWGLCEQSAQIGQPGLQQAENLLFEQAAAQGQTVFSASGDNGSDACNTNESPTPPASQDPVSVDDPTSQPYVVSVGGTSIDDASRRPVLEQVWGGGPEDGAGGGGISTSWEMPSWQRDSGVPGIALAGGAVWTAANRVETARGYPPGFCQRTLPGATGATPCRLVPDVSAEGDAYTGSVTVYSRLYAGTSFSTNGWTTTGGTSSSAPIWAAMLALVNASPACAGNPPTDHGVGFASPQLYQVAAEPAKYAAAFHDITTGSNDVDGLGGGRVFAAHRGYDLASGLGSPQLTGARGTAGLAYELCAAASSGRPPVVSRLSPATGSTAATTAVTITGSGFSSAGGDLVGSVQIGTRRLTGTSVRVLGPTTIAVTIPPAGDGLPPAAPAPQDGAGPANVIVTLRDGASSAPGPQAIFDYVDDGAGGAIASVDAISPSGGLDSATRPVTVLGAGLQAATAVSFGGVDATRFRIDGPHRIVVTPPALSPATQCVPLPGSPVYTGEGAGNDVCQVAVRVVDAHGVSASAQILAPPEGTVTLSSLGDVVLGAGCGCEGVTAPNEYDYLPAPRITSVSTSRGPADLASEVGSTLITIHGSGLDPLALEWADFGDPAHAGSQAIDYAFLSGTEMQIKAPARSVTVQTARVALSVRTLAGQSPRATVVYAGIPRVTGVLTPDNRRRLAGIPGAADPGGTRIRVTGRGFAGQLVAPVRFLAPAGASYGTQYVYRADGAGSVQALTVGQTPGLVDVRLCTVTGCSPASPRDRLLLYAPGSPRVTAVDPRSGPAAGGTQTKIAGENLSCPVQVRFGTRLARSLKAVPTSLACGSDALVTATSPPGEPGASVPVTVQTLESYFTGSGPGASTGRFSYAPS